MADPTITVAAVGDIVLSRPLAPAPPGSPVARTLALLHRADLVSASLEMPYSTRGQPRDKAIAFRADPALADHLRAFGFGVLSLANNHSLDHGWEALADTMERLDALGIAHVGAGATLTEAERGLILDIAGVRVGIVGCS